MKCRGKTPLGEVDPQLGALDAEFSVEMLLGEWPTSRLVRIGRCRIHIAAASDVTEKGKK